MECPAVSLAILTGVEKVLNEHFDNDIKNVKGTKLNEIENLDTKIKNELIKMKMNYMKHIPTILQGDVIEKMKDLADESIDLIVTSPPYWGQRDYDDDDQWGSEELIQGYLDNMMKWSNECLRTLKNEGTLFLNIGDKYDKKSLQMIPERLCIQMCDNGWVLRNKIIWYKPNHQPSGVKDRFVNTWEYIYFFNKDSGKYFNYKYYQNIDCLRINHKDQKPVEDKPEFPNTLSTEEYTEGGYEAKIKEHNEKKDYKGKYKNQTVNIGGSAGGRKSKGISYSKQRKAELTPSKKVEIHRYLKQSHKLWKDTKPEQGIDEVLGYKDKSGHWFREDPGGSLPVPGDWLKLKDILNFDESYDEFMTTQHYILQNVKNNPKGKNPGDLWTDLWDSDLWQISLQHSKEKHFAQFPLELPKKIIKAFCPSDGIVLDPFGGSGTTGLAAQELHRKSIMIELNPEFCSLMEKRFL